MQGVYVNYNRPKSKKQIREAVAADPHSVSVEATSMFGNEYDGPVGDMPEGTINFVGPDPHTKRNFYGNIVRKGDKFTVK
jgi:hypothetical protein